jgi:membrane fusion protein (multidrug efflux system)
MCPPVDNGPSPAGGPFPSMPGIRKASRVEPRARHVLRAAIFILPITIIGGALIYAAGGTTISTDHAHVSARRIGISSDVAGLVSEVDVVNNQHVTAGQVLFRLEPRPYQIVLDNAETNLLQTVVKLVSDKISYDQIMGDVAIEETMVQVDRATLDQYALLSDSGEINKQQHDQAEYELHSDVAKLLALRQQAQAILAKLNGKPNTPVTALPQYLQARGKVREAQRELDETVIKASFSGTVTDVPSFLQGKFLSAYAPAFHLVDTDHVWVNASPRATGWNRVPPGQKVAIVAHAYPALTWAGIVESVRKRYFSPLRSTGGNSPQVALPVSGRMRVDTHNSILSPLSGGLAAKLNVNMSRPRGLPELLPQILEVKA